MRDKSQVVSWHPILYAVNRGDLSMSEKRNRLRPGQLHLRSCRSQAFFVYASYRKFSLIKLIRLRTAGVCT